jgi:hypothetical protein
MNRVLFKSAKQDWTTPDDVYAVLDAEFHFKYDPCIPNPQFGQDGLKIFWDSPAFVNPPYKEIALWVRHAYNEWKLGKTVVMLIPSRTDTRWWHDYVMEATEIRFIKGRLKFGGAVNSAPFPSAVVVFRGVGA